eukprot:GILK01006290.1.p1 GENE.GILK01006290.1~~GILK01006290.1.p1  ORF type:complete len:687 (+),score=122.15 GILK01006290.1:37-2061(+)
MGNVLASSAPVYAVVDDVKENGYSAIRRSPLAEKFLAHETPVKSLYENFQHGMRRSKEGPFLGTRRKNADGSFGEYVWKSYAECWELSTYLASAMMHYQLAPRQPSDEVKQGRVGIFSINREEWMLAEQAANMQSIVTVPLYDTLGPDAVEFIINQASLVTVFCSADKTKTLLTAKNRCPTLKFVVQFEDASAADKESAIVAGVTLVDFKEMFATGKANPCAHNPPSAEDIATFCYTSGTTGDPKGAMLTHRNCLTDAEAGRFYGISIGPSDVHISYLPLAHMFERMVTVSCIFGGTAIGFYNGNALKLLDDLTVLRPTFFPSVPRLFNRIYERITSQVKATGGIKQALFEKAFESKKWFLKRGFYTHPLWDKLVFSKVAARLGGRVRFMVTGSAPISDQVKDFLRICFSCPILEGYGQTECTAAATVALGTDVTNGHVGGPLPVNEIRLEDVPDMNYTSNDIDEHGNPMPRGEVCIRGSNVFVGYYRQPDKTAEALDNEGWLHTGDIGQWLDNGNLKIIDRKKNIFKLAQGEYVAAEKIENVYIQCPLVAQVFVYGDSLKAHLIAIVVPNQDTLIPWAASHNVEGDFKFLCSHPEVNKLLLQEMNNVGKQLKLRGFEFVKSIFLESEPFSPENGLLTPTFKLKRHDAKQKYQTQIDALYALGVSSNGRELAGL